MLRGYHPVKEIYRWERVIFALCFLSIGVLVLEDSVEHTDVTSPGAGNIAFFSSFLSLSSVSGYYFFTLSNAGC